MSAETNKAIVRRLAQVVNSGNLDQLDKILAPDCVRHDPNLLLKEVGREEYKRTFTNVREALSDAI